MSEVVLQRSINDEKPRRKRASDEVPPSVGPTSASPGPWLTHAIVDGLEADERHARQQQDPVRKEKHWPIVPMTDGEIARYEGAVEILLSYYFPHAVAAAAFDGSPCHFPMVDQPNVLAGPEWLKYRQDRAATCAEYKAWLATQKDDEDVFEEKPESLLSRLERNGFVENRDAELVDKPKETVPKDFASTVPLDRPCSKKQLKAAYDAWYADPSEKTQSTLHETLHDHFSKKSKLTPSGDLLRREGLSEDFQQEFILEILQTLSGVNSAEFGVKVSV